MGPGTEVPKVLESLDKGAQGALPRATLGFQLPPDSELGFKEVMSRGLVIEREAKHSWLDIIRLSDQSAAVDALVTLGKQAKADVVMRWAGGCKGFNPEDVENLMTFVAKGMVSSDGIRHFQGSVGSGGTQDFDKDGAESVMITQVPYYLARLTDAIAWGSTPATYGLRIKEATEGGGVVVSKYGAVLDARGHKNILTQESAYETQGWNGDVRWYMGALEKMQEAGYKAAIGVVNGGEVTLDEALLALSKNIPVILVDGTGRAAEQLVKAAQEGNIPDLYNSEALARGTLVSTDKVPTQQEIDRLLHIVHIKDPAGLSAVSDKLGLLTDL